MADQKQTEEVDLKLASGELVTVKVPKGLSDSQVRTLMMLKRPDLAPPPGVPKPQLSEPSGLDRVLTTLGLKGQELATGAIESAAQTLPESAVTDTSRILNAIPFIGEHLAPSAGVRAMREGGLPTPETTAEKIGAGLETAAEFAIPAGAAAKGASKVPAIAKLLQVSPKLGRILLGAGIGGVVGGAQGGAREGIEGIVPGAETGASFGALGGAIQAIPRIGRSGKALGEVKRDIGKVPIDVSRPGDVALEAKELAESGGQLAKVMRDFIKRTTDPQKGPLTFREARNFYSNATRLSKDEFDRLTPVMKRQAALFTQELGKSIQATANATGQGTKFASAMKESAQAHKLQGLKKGVKKAVKIAAPAGATGFLVKEYIDRR